MRVTIKTQPDCVIITIDDLCDNDISMHSCTEACTAATQASQGRDEQQATTQATTPQAASKLEAKPTETPVETPQSNETKKPATIPHKTVEEMLENVEDVEKLETLLLAAKKGVTINDAANLYAEQYGRRPSTAIARIKVLRQRGLVNATRHGNNRYLSLTSEGEKLLELIQNNKSEPTETETETVETEAETNTVEVTANTVEAEAGQAMMSIEELILEKCTVPRTMPHFVEHAATLTCRTQQEINSIIEKLLEEGRLTRWSSQKIIATTAV